MICILFYSEFCNHENQDVPLLPSDIHKANAVEYEIEPAPKTEEETEDKPDNDSAEATDKSAKLKQDNGRTNHLVIFTVDISGSMNITTEVPALQGIIIISIL